MLHEMLHEMLLLSTPTTSEATTDILEETSWGSSGPYGETPALQSQHTVPGTWGIVLQRDSLLALQGESLGGGQMSQSHA